MLLLFLFLNFLLPNDSTQLGGQATLNTYRVIAINGTDMYEEPEFTSGIINRITQGISLSILTDSLKPDVKSYNNSFELPGYWLEIDYNSLRGYVFSSDLSKKNILTGNRDTKMVLDSFLGEQLDKIIVEDSIKYGDDLVYYRITTTKYEFGELSEQPFDGCYNVYYTFKHYNLSEVYHLMMNLYYYEFDGFEYPTYKGLKNSKYIFEPMGMAQFELYEDEGIITFYKTACD
jgi:hypothetical protein